MGQGPSVDDLLAAARADFAARLPAKVEDLLHQASRDGWQGVRLGAHKLRGSAATYGFAALGATAAAIEECLLACACSPDAPTRDRIQAALREAHAEAARAALEGR